MQDEEEVWEVGEAEMLQTWQGLRELQWVPLLQATITQLLHRYACTYINIKSLDETLFLRHPADRIF